MAARFGRAVICSRRIAFPVGIQTHSLFSADFVEEPTLVTHHDPACMLIDMIRGLVEYQYIGTGV